jgi:Ca2+-binding EF-hand superfamily protein
MDGSGDTDSECEYVERVEARLLRRSGEEDNGDARRALRNYACYLRNEAAVRNLRLAHQHNLKTLNLKIQHLQHRLSKSEGNFTADNILATSLAAPYVHFDGLQFAFAMLGLADHDLRRHLSTFQRERETEISTFERLLQDMVGQSGAIEGDEMSLVRSHLVGRINSKRDRSKVVVDKSIPRGEQILIKKRAENSAMTAFFEKHEGKTFSALRHHDVIELGVIFAQVDVNHSGFIESDDFSKLVRRLLCDFSVSQLEVDRMAILCRLSTADGFALPLETFFEASSKLMSLLEGKADEFLLVEDQSNERFRTRQSQAASDETLLYELERDFQKRLHKLQHGKGLPPGNTEDTILQVVLERELARTEWAKTAVILTPLELDRMRIHNIALSKRQASAQVLESDADHEVASSQKKKVALPGVQRQPAPPADVGQRATSAGSSRQYSASGMLDVFKASLRAALHRAPLVDIQRAEDIPNETMEREFYQLFTVLSKQDDFITTEHLHFLFEIFTPCGADKEEAGVFLSEECDGAETLVFDEFVKFGLKLKHRLLAYEDFCALPSDKDRVRAIEDRVCGTDEMNSATNREKSAVAKRPKALRRYEKEFIRCQEALRSVAVKRSRQDGSAGGSRSQYTPLRINASPNRQSPHRHEEETPDWAASNSRSGEHPGEHLEKADAKSSSSVAAGADGTTRVTSTALVTALPDHATAPQQPHHSSGAAMTTPRSQRQHSGRSNRSRYGYGSTPRTVASASSATQRALIPTQPMHHGDPGKQLPIMRFAEREDFIPDVHGYRKLQDDALVGCLKQVLLKLR